MVADPQVARWTLGSPSATTRQLVVFTAPSSESSESVEDELSLPEDDEESSFCYWSASAQSGCEGSWIWPDRVRSG